MFLQKNHFQWNLLNIFMEMGWDVYFCFFFIIFIESIKLFNAIHNSTEWKQSFSNEVFDLIEWRCKKGVKNSKLIHFICLKLIQDEWLCVDFNKRGSVSI